MNERNVRREAAKHGYRIAKDGDDYTLINERSNAVVYHCNRVSLDAIAEFLQVAN